jgi:predicted RNA-binding protein YlqC (UPF0109 family)
VEKLEKLLRFIIGQIVKEGVEIKIDNSLRGDTVTFHVRVSDGELGKIIGKNGLTANAIRGVMQAAGVKDKLNVNVEFLD